MDKGAEYRLATYGTLAPGRPNHHKLDGLTGTWIEGVVRGRLVEQGWGADLGYPAIILDETAALVSVFIFESDDLPDHWPEFDSFEGKEYVRTATWAETDTGRLRVSIYALA